MAAQDPSTESGGVNMRVGGTSTGTGFGPERSVNPKTSTAGETFDSGEKPVLAEDADSDGLTSGYGPTPSASSADHGTPSSIPDTNVVNRGYRNSKTPLPTPTRKGTQRQSY